MKLSFSTMRLLHDCPHNYINKITGIKQPESIYLIEGKAAHRIMQEHVSGRKLHPDFAHINFKFPIVEEKDFDERLSFEVPYKEYIIRGFVDGLDKLIPEKPEDLLEGKFSGSPWSNKKYKDDPQRKIYAWAIRSIKKCHLITGKRKPEEWRSNRIKTTSIEVVEKDYADAEKYMDEAIEVLETGDFKSDLVDGFCRDPRCYWGDRCLFK